MAGASTNGPTGHSRREPEKGGSEVGADLSQSAGPRVSRQQTSYTVAMSLSAKQFERLALHATAMGMDPKEAARALLLQKIEGPIDDVIAKQRDATQINQRKVKLITVEVEVVRNKPKEKRTFVEIELSKEQQQYVNVWKALLHGMTDRFHLGTLSPIEGLIPFCLYPDSPYNLPKNLLIAKLTDNVPSLPRLNSDSLDILSPVEREQGGEVPPVVGLSAERVAWLIRKSQPTIKEITDQLSAARAQNGGIISGIAMDNKEAPSLSEQDLAVIGRIGRSCETILKPKREGK